MTTLSFPTLNRTAPTELSDWRPVGNAFEHQSPYTATADTVAMVGQKWAFTAIWRNLGHSDRAILGGWLAQLGSRAGRFYFSHPRFKVPRGTARGTGTVSAASQFATTITLNGLAAGSTVLVGDFVQIGTALLVRATADGTASGGGVITALAVAPMLRVAVSGGTAFTLVAPRAQFRFKEDVPGISELPGPDGALGGFGEFTLDAIEEF